MKSHIAELIAATKAVKKTPEQLRAVKLQNLEKARAAKAQYKREDDEAIKRGEIPPSVARKKERDFPILLDNDNKVRTLD